MSMFAPQSPSMRLTLRVLAHLLRYPDAQWRAHLSECGAAIKSENALSASRQAELQGLLERLAQRPALEVEAEFVELFDRGRSTSLHLFEHVHGDSRDRGSAMIDLIQTYEQAGLLLSPHELPDHLAVVLEFASTQPKDQAREFLAETAHIVRMIFSALLKRASPYASVLGAALELAGETVQSVAVPDESDLDESWAEPQAFGACSSAGQARPGQEQPLRFMKKSSMMQGAQA